MTNLRISSHCFCLIVFLEDGRPRQDSVHLNLGRARTYTNNNNDDVIITNISGEKQDQTKKKKRREPFYLPHWVLYPAWVLNVLTILGCAFLVVWYGMTFGNKKSLDWLASVSIGLVGIIIIKSYHN